METVNQIIERIAHQFLQVDLTYGHGTDNAWDEASWLVHYALGLNYGGPEEQYQQEVQITLVEQIESLAIARIKTRKPMAYLTQQMWFADIEFYVDERVLVPRSPIAELIRNQFFPWLDIADTKRVLDLCTGSGCIGMATAIHAPHLDVVCSDISDDALEVAKINLARLELNDQVTLVQSDLFENLAQQKFDLIVSNPPYVDSEDMANLSSEFKHEPELGLASGHDGLIHTRKILENALDYLTNDGKLIIEVGNSMQALQETYPHVPFMWLEFENGGDGVFMLTKEQLKHYFN